MENLAIASLDCHIHYCIQTGARTVSIPIEEAQNILELIKKQGRQIKELKMFIDQIQINTDYERLIQRQTTQMQNLTHLKT